MLWIFRLFVIIGCIFLYYLQEENVSALILMVVILVFIEVCM